MDENEQILLLFLISSKNPSKQIGDFRRKSRKVSSLQQMLSYLMMLRNQRASYRSVFKALEMCA